MMITKEIEPNFRGIKTQSTHEGLTNSPNESQFPFLPLPNLYLLSADFPSSTGM
jgi:hypothetical protein